MKANILSAIAALGLVAAPALATTKTTVKQTKATAHRTVAQVCASERALAKAKKESWKVANARCDAAKRQAHAAVSKAKHAEKQATKSATKG